MSLHLIQSQRIELDLRETVGESYALQEQMNRYFHQEMVPLMERIFDQRAGEEEVVLIPRLEIDLGLLREGDLFRPEMLARFAERLQAALRQTNGVQPQHQSPQQSIWEQWLYFLENGRLPWHGRDLRAEALQKVLTQVRENESSVEQLRQLLRSAPLASRRLLLQYDSNWLIDLLEAVQKHPLPQIRQLLAVLKGGETQAAGAGVNAKSLTDAFGDFLLDVFVVQEAAYDTSAWEQIPGKWLGERQAMLSVNSVRTLRKTFPALRQYLPDRPESTPPSAPAERFPKGQHQPDEMVSQKPHAPASDLAFSAGVPTKEESNTVLPPSDSESDSGPEPSETASDSSDQKSINQASADQKATETSSEATSKTAPLSPQNAENLETQPLAELPPEITGKSVGHSSNELEPTVLPQPRNVSEAPDLERESAYALSDQSHFIANAGVVLLHVYLSAFWERLEWSQAGRFRSEEDRQWAALSLHYLACGERQAPEYRLLLPKLLCGIPLNLPLDGRLSLSDEQVEEAEHLLEAVIEHWAALGEVSNDSLREGFLQRPGKLSLKSGKWQLQVERQTIDLLLDRLPWTLSIVKLPWMPDALRVEWN